VKQNIKFRKMTENEYNNWIEWSVSDYTKSLIISGQYSEIEAQEQAREDFYSYLKNGLSTQNHYLFIVEDIDGTSVGMIWYEIENPERAFIADLLVYDEYRRMGYGRAILIELEHTLKKIGIPFIELHVFEHNNAAVNLYRKCGFTQIEVNDADAGSLYMQKRIV